jgi:uncharacterized protein
MNITDGEKLILLMLSELYERLNIEGEINPEFIKSAIFSQNLWGIPWKYSGIPFENQDTPPIVKEVLDILDMWSFIERAYQKLSEDDQKKLEEDAHPFGKDPKFPGFDGNNESEHMNIASFLINDLERFQEFKGRSLNAHMPTLDTYHRMISAFEKIRNTLVSGPMSLAQLTTVLREKIHPEHREAPNK